MDLNNPSTTEYLLMKRELSVCKKEWSAFETKLECTRRSGMRRKQESSVLGKARGVYLKYKWSVLGGVYYVKWSVLETRRVHQKSGVRWKQECECIT